MRTAPNHERSVALDDEGLSEVRHAQHMRGGDRGFELGEGRGCLDTPCEAVPLEGQ
jgi:hypothetical protein